MKRLTLSLIAFALALAFVGCASAPAATVLSYEDGTYRGVYGETDNQVTIELTLKDNVVTKISFRNLAYRGVNYRTSTEEGIVTLRNQYQALIDYLVGKDIRVSLGDLYKPGQIVDAVGGATLRSAKIISAIRDALNRGVYAY